MNTYKIQTGPKNEHGQVVHWLSLELMAIDLQEQMNSPEIQARPDVLQSLEVVKMFIDALIQEGRANDYYAEHGRPDDTEMSYRDIIIQ
jgi:hypothetical protein